MKLWIGGQQLEQKRPGAARSVFLLWLGGVVAFLLAQLVDFLHKALPLVC